ncbi:LysR substrate-binding domain-containing protein [Caulobacter mirabilis]|uniref:LysR family transcriptional regulator n=1 Tax=Caulobacter mirabilis TaxID=69666 RepID=A0A2D2AVU0_9CAUL|nr:LysR substrate-binding domain-containing protein [Caulobacter mirabilis]ATQ42091.1 LysR family transcriptional regulator [Caulobacter mirabilis]
MARRNLPSLNALRAFEAFGRHGRMTLAADELFVTHGAVSRQIRQLEEDLGQPLTEGPRNRLRLTEAGLKLAQALTRALDSIDDALPRPAEAERPLVVACLGTLAMKWLIPRLPAFLGAHPDIPVRIEESNGAFDFRQDGVDLAVRMRNLNDHRSPDAEVTFFMDNYHGPVVSPDLVGDGSARTLGRLPRLHTVTHLAGWSDWLATSGVAVADSGVRRDFDHNFYMVEAAAAGLGVAIGPWAFVQTDLASGRLKAPMGFVRSGVGFVALLPRTGARPEGRLFRDWLVAEGAATPPPPEPYGLP